MWRTVAVVFGWQTAASLCYYSVFAAVPFVRDAFDLSPFLVGFVVSALTVGQILLLLPAGGAVDAYGERRTMLAGLAGLALASGLLAVAWSYPAVLAGVFLLGALYATSMPATNKAVSAHVASARQNVGMGVKQVGVTLGSGASSLLVPVVAGAAFGWQAGFLAVAALAGLALAGFAVAYDRDARGGDARLPPVRRLLADPAYRSLVAAGVFLGAGLFTTAGYVIVYLHARFGLPYELAGATLAGMQVAGSGGRVLVGYATDRVARDDPRSAVRALGLQAAAMAVLFASVRFLSRTAVAVAVFVVAGFVVFGFTGMYYSSMSLLVEGEVMGAASAVGQMALGVGALFAPPAFGYLATRLGYGTGWWFLAAAAVAAALLLVHVDRTVDPG